MLRIDIAPANYQHLDPGVLDLREAGLVAIFDGAGTWGSGGEAAVWVRDELLSRLRGVAGIDSRRFQADLNAAAASLPEELRDPGWDDQFSVAAALLSDSSIQVCAAGRYGALHVTSVKSIPLYTPGSWVMEQVEAGILTREEARGHALRNVSTGPYFSHRESSLFVNEPVRLGVGESIVIVELDLFQELLYLPHTTWRGLQAAELQKLTPGDRKWVQNVIKISDEADA